MTQAITQSRPTVPVPFGDVVSLDAPRLPKTAPSVKVAAGYCQCIDHGIKGTTLSHARTKCRPSTAVPFGNRTGWETACGGEIPARVEHTAGECERINLSDKGTH